MVIGTAAQVAVVAAGGQTRLVTYCTGSSNHDDGSVAFRRHYSVYSNKHSNLHDYHTTIIYRAMEYSTITATTAAIAVVTGEQKAN